MDLRQAAAAAKALLMAVMLSLLVTPSAKSEDIINVDTSGVASQYRFAFQQAEAFWDKTITGYSRKLPRFVRRQLGDINIVATTPFIDGAGGILGSAAPTRTVDFAGYGGKRGKSRAISISQEGIMNFDIADMDDLYQSGDLVDVVMHEMAHALGYGSLWAQNELLGTVDEVTQYRHDGYALERYRGESGNSNASFVPLEQDGGGGTALSHLDDDDPFFNPGNGRSELMLGFLQPGTQFVSETSKGIFADLWFVVDGINNGEQDNPIRRGPRRPKTWGGYPSWLNLRAGSLTAVPEPGSMVVIALVFGVGAIRRRR